MAVRPRGILKDVSAFMFDCNGVIYYRKERRLNRFEQFLKDNGWYTPLSEDTKKTLERLKHDACNIDSFFIHLKLIFEMKLSGK